MTIDQLRRVHNTRPFIPFFMHLADGRSVPVTHPENRAFYGAGRTVHVTNGPETEIVDLLLVASLRLAADGELRRNGR